LRLSRILCAIDNDVLADAVFDFGYDLAIQVNAELGLVHVDQTPYLLEGSTGITAVLEAQERDVRELFDRLINKKNGAKITAFPEKGDPKQVISLTAIKWKADLIVMASHGRKGVSHLLVGSVAESVLRSAPCAVLVLPSGHRQRESALVELGAIE
jgi:nucleotide-binding universal stress UspA family protein